METTKPIISPIPQSQIKTSAPTNCQSVAEHNILKTFIVCNLYQLLCDKFLNKNHSTTNIYTLEPYYMDSATIQFMIQDILNTDEYNLEGIAYYTRIPFDIIYDAACGIGNQSSITLWTRLIDLYLQVKPDIADLLIEKLIDAKTKHQNGIRLILNET